MRKISNLTFILSLVIVVLSCISSFLGAFIPSVYKNETERFAADFRGQDIATLVVIIPLFIHSIIRSRRGSVRGILMWLGILTFYIYQFLLYALGTVFNYLYLVYIFAFSISAITFIIGILEIDFNKLKTYYSGRFLIYTTAIYELTLAIMLAVLWISNIIQRYYHDRLGIVDEESSVKLIAQAMDLGFLVPWGICAGCFLLQKKIIGFFMTSILLMGAPCLFMVFISARISTRMEGIEIVFEEQLFGFGGILILLFLTYRFFKEIPEHKEL